MSAAIRGFYVDAEEGGDVHGEQSVHAGYVYSFCWQAWRVAQTTGLGVFAPTRTRSICAPCVTAIEREHAGRKAT